MNPSDNHNSNTVDAVVEEILAELTLAERVGTADLDENEFRVLELIMGKIIRYKLDQKDVAVNKELTPATAATVRRRGARARR